MGVKLRVLGILGSKLSRHSFPNARPNQSLSTITGPNQPLSTTTSPAQPYSNTTTSPSSPAPRHVTPCGSHRSSSLARPDSVEKTTSEFHSPKSMQPPL
ncbi:unnamed protein product [Gadus morhua 'NCC']